MELIKYWIILGDIEQYQKIQLLFKFYLDINHSQARSISINSYYLILIKTELIWSNLIHYLDIMETQVYFYNNADQADLKEPTSAALKFFTSLNILFISFLKPAGLNQYSQWFKCKEVNRVISIQLIFYPWQLKKLNSMKTPLQSTVSVRLSS